ncbi:MAG: sulfatase, partial [Acidobacteriota bacterium]
LVEVSLDAWARKPVEVVLWADGEGDGCGDQTIAFGAPAVDGIGPLPPVPGSAERPNVLLVGLDTMRADHLGAYGRTPSPSPAFDRLAAESDLFENAYSTFNVTNPSFTSILTGLWGKNHGVYDLQTVLPEEQTTLAERFSDAGWRTFSVLAAGHLGPERSGLGQGFDAVDVAAGQYAAESAVDQAIRWISGLAQDPEPTTPFFLWLHLFDVHTPHTPPRPFARGLGVDGLTGMAPVAEWSPRRELGLRAFDEPVLGGHEDLYFDELRYLDHQLDRVYDFLASRGLLETTIVAVVADHGENFGEQGLTFRHAGLWDATTHIPLLVRRPGPPGRSGRRFPGLVQSIDLVPTLLDLAGLEPHTPLDGQDLYELTENGRGRRAVFAEESDNIARMVRTHDHLLMQADPGHPFVDGDLLFDLRADPEQQVNLIGRGLPVEAELRDLLGRWLRDRRDRAEATAVELSEEERQQLQALGYIDN